MDARVWRAFSQIHREEKEFLQHQITMYTRRLNADTPSLARQIQYQRQIARSRQRANTRIEARFVRVLDQYGYPSDNGPYYDPDYDY
ncbi:hypothetical protein C8F04DRAFT_1272798 [Mycena alexandri]|uniref:Uncharacterized protein n=1 Tax=Mycena alexandri TaxID=1745969 RepID=A0AAD6WRA6_9AGAR|nr:hypothetical protein C8F04DRAFT_1272798 [Mycena alexandri]